MPAHPAGVARELIVTEYVLQCRFYLGMLSEWMTARVAARHHRAAVAVCAGLGWLQVAQQSVCTEVSRRGIDPNAATLGHQGPAQPWQPGM